MIDPSRPVAPYLPPEIISRILQFFHPRPTALSNRSEEEPEEHLDFSEAENRRELASLARVARNWRYELEKLVGTLQTRLAAYTNSLHFNLPSNQQGAGTLLFLLLQSSVNLKEIELNLNSSIDFDTHQITLMGSNLYLPRLNTIKYHDRGGNVLNTILSTAPNLEKLVIERFYPNEDHIPISDKLLKLKELTVGRNGYEFMSNFRNFEGLETLRIQETEGPINQSLLQRIFRQTGPTLIELEMYRLDIGFTKPLIALQHLTVSTFNSTHALIYPASITRLTIKNVGESDLISLPDTGLNLFKNLEILEIGILRSKVNLNTLPHLKILRIQLAATEKVVIESLKTIEA